MRCSGLGAVVLGVVVVATACPSPELVTPTPDCQLYMQCFFPGNSAEQTYETIGAAGRNDEDLACYAGFGSDEGKEMIDLLRDTYGPTGTCWRRRVFGEDGSDLAPEIQASCDERCGEALKEACLLLRDGHLEPAAVPDCDVLDRCDDLNETPCAPGDP
jgi:hypothetical protein